MSYILMRLHRWDGNNGPEQTDYVAVKNLIAATPKSVKRFVLTTSAGVERSGQFPFVILNLFGAPCQAVSYLVGNPGLLHIPQSIFLARCLLTSSVIDSGVLKYKRQSELLLQQSGLPWTILRPSRLTDGPYTSYDLNTLLQATAGSRQDIQVSMQDDQVGETSRIAAAGMPEHANLLSVYVCCFFMAIGRYSHTFDISRLHAQRPSSRFLLLKRRREKHMPSLARRAKVQERILPNGKRS